MQEYRINLLRKQFPFLNLIFPCIDGEEGYDLTDVDDIKVKKGDRNLLGRTGREESYRWSRGDYRHYTVYFAAWADPESVQMLGYEINWAKGSGEYGSTSADPIGDQLYARGLSPDFIVECTKEDTDANENGTIRHYWTIHKMKDFNLAKHHKDQIDKAAAILKAEIDAACA